MYIFTYTIIFLYVYIIYGMVYLQPPNSKALILSVWIKKELRSDYMLSIINPL
jgi:hypothetical protein